MITTYKTGPAYPAAGYGILSFFILLGLFILIFFESTTAMVLGGVFVVVAVYYITITKSLVIEQTRFRMVRKTILGPRGKWVDIKEDDAIILKYVLLTDRNRQLNNVRVGPMGPFAIGLFDNNTANKEKAWTLSFKSKGKPMIKLLTSSKEQVFKLTNQILSERFIDVYSGVYKEDRKLNRNELKKGKVVFIKKPKSAKRR